MFADVAGFSRAITRLTASRYPAASCTTPTSDQVKPTTFVRSPYPPRSSNRPALAGLSAALRRLPIASDASRVNLHLEILADSQMLLRSSSGTLTHATRLGLNGVAGLLGHAGDG